MIHKTIQFEDIIIELKSKTTIEIQIIEITLGANLLFLTTFDHQLS